MYKIGRKIGLFVLAAAAASVFAVGIAHAQKDDYVGYVQYGPASMGDKGGTYNTSSVQKSDTYDYAVVYLDDGYPTFPVYISVINNSGKAVTIDDYVTSSGRRAITYNSGEGIYANYYYLHFHAGYSGTTVKGRWAP